ncbi:ABC transporter permease [Luteibacter sp.]|uniref:ABC transporter permease n=1 Tax=Luteibacter sp. TaxID=1886636 RepID=UPI0028097787|nr:ABC transporter permease [Luteibacter sp.]MDQ8051000.1 ABC transporter permease [Luteibacter sp.]
MKQHGQADTSPLGLVRSLRNNRELIIALTRREVAGRYRGSVMGLLWSFLYPLLMLAVYTFVFSVVFKSRWPSGGGSKAEFALVLFTGLMVFSVFSECVNRAPGLVLNNINYVKKVVFPLEILPVVSLLSSSFHMLVSTLVWTGFYLVYFGTPPITALLLPVVLAPLAFFTLGLTWMLASLGVYLRDVGQVVGVATTVLLFMSPVFYAIDSLPESYRPIMRANPLTATIEQARDVMIWGRGLDLQVWLVMLAVGFLVAWLGYAWFQGTRRGFADVL